MSKYSRNRNRTVKVMHYIQYDTPYNQEGDTRCSLAFDMPKADLKNNMVEFLKNVQIPGHPVAGRIDYTYNIGVLLNENAIDAHQVYVKCPQGHIHQPKCSCCTTAKN